MSMEELLAYCMKCKTKRAVAEGEAVYTKSGQPATRGTCSECGTTLYRMGETPAHANVPKPVTVSSRKRTPTKERRGKVVIVESPAKARTLGNYLDKGYRVKASVGHVRDLLKSQLSVDVEKDFTPRYRVPNDKREIVKELKTAVGEAAEVYLATDPDREGEAIAWHLMDVTGVEEPRVRRVVFYELTREAVREAFRNPRKIDMDKVNAQQARRILDRLVGYELSPLLWEKVRPRLSAGRVQSVAVRLVVEREREIEGFVPEEYWTIDAELARSAERDLPERQSFIARLHRIRQEQVNLPSEESVKSLLAELEQAEYVVNSVERGQRRRKSAAPFTTSTLQQEASRRLGFRTGRTMQIAQQLYEGVDVGDGGEVGLITYMRTDSHHVAAQAQDEARAFIVEQYGQEYLPEEPNVYAAKSKLAQEAHEAIRPTSIYRTPESLKKYLRRDQYQVYTLIWQRFVASQMAPAVYDTIRIDILAGMPGTAHDDKPYLFRASGSALRFIGFLAVYADMPDEDSPEDEELGRIFPDLFEGDWLDLLRLIPEQHFTQPPSRYTEASLVKALEEYGIGRPSTYAPIMDTILRRGYVERDAKRLRPTEIGSVVNDLLVKHFEEVVDLGFTAKMEDSLDQIASGKREWVPVLQEFYNPFKAEVDWAHENIPDIDLGDEQIGRDCPNCGKPLVVRWGRFGKFIGCSDFPTCRYTEPWLDKIGVACPACDGELVERKTRRGRTFYGCINYPECTWTSWKRPLVDPCPACGGLLTVHNKEWARCQICEKQVHLDTLSRTESREHNEPA